MSTEEMSLRRQKGRPTLYDVDRLELYMDISTSSNPRCIIVIKLHHYYDYEDDKDVLIIIF